MRILVVQFAAAVRGRRLPRFEPRLATVLALLRARGHTVSLLAASRFDLEAAKRALAAGLPQLVYADISSVCLDTAQRTLQYLSREQFLPIVAGGVHAAVDPDACLSLPGVTAVALGEPDAALLAYLERLRDPAIGQTVRGIWSRDERGLERPQMPDLIEDLDSLPFPERGLFEPGEAGGRVRIAAVAIGRGEVRDLGYTLNATVRGLYGNPPHWVRRRTVESVLEELAGLSSADGRVAVRFLDRDFVRDAAWRRDFVAGLTHAEAGAAGPPAWSCVLPPECAEPAVLAELAAGGCRMVRVEVVSGSDFIRNEVFETDAHEEQLRDAFERVRAAGLRSTALVFGGAPYESEESLRLTEKLLEALRPDALDARAYYPFPGTAAARLARENGWIHPRGEEQFHLELPGVEMPTCRAPLVTAALRAWRKRWPAPAADWWVSDRPAGRASWWRR